MITDNFNNITGLHNALTSINSASNGLFGLLVLAGTFVILFISLKSYLTETALLTSSIVTSVLAVLLWGAGLINIGYVFFPLLVFVGSIIFYLSKRE